MKTYINHSPKKNILAILAIGDYYLFNFDKVSESFSVEVDHKKYVFTNEFTESETFKELLLNYLILVGIPQETPPIPVKDLTLPRHMKLRRN